MPTTVTPPACRTSLLSYFGLLAFERLDTGGQCRRIRTWTYDNIRDCYHAQKRNQRQQYFHDFLLGSPLSCRS